MKHERASTLPVDGSAAQIPALSVKGLSKRYPTAGGLLHAVDDVTLSIARGRSLGLVGESGCGKSTLVRLIARMAARVMAADLPVQSLENAPVFDAWAEFAE